MSPEIKAAAEWLEEQARNTAFGEVGISLILHDSRISKIQKTIITKVKPTDDGGPRTDDPKQRSS